MLDYLESLADDGVLHKRPVRNGRPATTFLDLGTGNGHMLFELRQQGWHGLAIGVDYSEVSVKLARQIGEARAKARTEALNQRVDKDEDEENGCSYEDLDEDEASWAPVRFEEFDLLSGQRVNGMPAQGFDVLLDKGTFDAISLSASTGDDGRRVNEAYPDKVAPLLKPGGLFLITSCNWTEEELKTWFVQGEGKPFLLKDKIKYPSFTFGGKTGQSVVTLCFEKKSA